MSAGGMELLARLRAQRQRPPPEKSPARPTPEQSRPSSSLSDEPRAPAPAAGPSSAGAQLAGTVGVCAAVDCAGEGSGACFLELEELAAEMGSQGPQVCRVPCLRACGSGPNVCVTIQDASSLRMVSQEVHLRVRGPSECASLAHSVASELLGMQNADVGAASASSGPDVRYRILKRRADVMRWEALTKLSRRQTSQEGMALLQAAGAADLAAARLKGPLAEQRSRRRAERLIKSAQAFIRSDQQPLFPSLGVDSTQQAKETKPTGGAADFRARYAKQFH